MTFKDHLCMAGERARKTRLLLKHIERKSIFSFVRLILLACCYRVIKKCFSPGVAMALFGNRKMRVAVRGVTFEIPAWGNDLNYLVECFILKVYESLPSFAPGSGGTYLDIGSNIGCCSLSWFQEDPGGIFFCCEPNPPTAERLKRNISLNGCENFHVLGCAVSSRNGSIGMRILENSLMAVAGGGTGSGSSPVACRTLDDIISSEGITTIDICKIDVEGHEAEVLRGARNSLGSIKRLVIEYHSSQLLKEIKGLIAGRFKIKMETANLIFAERQ
jgi:FkbM family methyltransferase